MEVLDYHYYHEDFKSTFENLCCKSFQDVMTYYLHQMSLSGSKQDKRKLDILSTLLLSRIMPKIHKFNKDPKTSDHKSDYHWNVVLGNVC